VVVVGCSSGYLERRFIQDPPRIRLSLVIVGYQRQPYPRSLLGSKLAGTIHDWPVYQGFCAALGW
jgi:hypothetical protein